MHRPATGARSPSPARPTAPLARHAAIVAAALALPLLPAACVDATGGADGESAYEETGDLAALRARGRLRVLVPSLEPPTYSRSGFGLERDLDLVDGLAESLGVEADVRGVEDRAAMLRDLLEGRGDLVVANLTVTDSRRERFAFSIPVGSAREIVVARASDGPLDGPEDLEGRTIAVRRSASYYETAMALRETVPGLEVRTVSERLETEELLHRVALGEHDLTLCDDDLLDAVLEYRDDLRAAFPATPERPFAWAMRPDNPVLKDAVDAFLHAAALGSSREVVVPAGLEEIKRRRVLRVLTRNNAACSFLHRGAQVGFEYEFARRFARSIGCRIQVIVPPTADRLIPWLLEGRGDLIAASMTVTGERAREVAFTRPYNRVREVLVVRSGDRSLESIADLAGRRVAVRPSSSYRESLESIRASVPLTIVDAPEHLETEDLIGMVASGEIEATVADSHIAAIETAWRDDIRVAFPISGPRPLAWAVRPDDGGLLEAADAFLARENRGTFQNVLFEKYFTSPGRIARLAPSRPARAGRISPWDDLFRKHGRAYDIDWRLLAAQAFQESGFRRDRRSWAGAVGLMQLLPATAREMGAIGDLTDPDTNIRAGARYLRRLLDRLEPGLPTEERIRFALAAYNVGYGHLLDGRRLARRLGLDSDVWYGQVEVALPKLSQAANARAARFGYCRCREPVAYVREINERYVAYTRALDREDSR